MKIAILGFGTIGSGVWEVLQKNRKIIEKRLSDAVEIAHVLDLRDFPAHPVQKVLVKDIAVILEDPAVNVVVECMGGLSPAYEFVKGALEAGKSVATSNKELVAEKGAELTKTAEDHGVDFFYEASVGGGIPVIRTLRQSFASETVLEIQGILNGTTNYILTQMEQNRLPYADALEKAQRLGYAEKNPEMDVEGTDACRKLAILSSLAYGANVRYEDIPTEGITGITMREIAEAKAENRTIRLVARSKMEDGVLHARVSPVWLPAGHPLAAVRDVYNAVRIRGNMVDDILLEGKGAGREATASAMVSDVIAALRNRRLGVSENPVWDERTIPVCAAEREENVGC